jgi:hypothetical protein
VSPKDHKHAAGVVCVAMSAEQVTRLFEFADAYGLTQDQAMRRVIDIGLACLEVEVSQR